MESKDETVMVATKLAADTAATAVALATKTAETAQETAKATAVINNNIEWMRKSLLGIEDTLRGMVGLYASTKEFDEFKKQADDREERIRAIEKNMWRWLGIASVLSAGLAMGISYILSHI